jgi:4,5-DOPA dioxygenase extradiol
MKYKNRRTPLIFVGHGSPMNAINNNKFTIEWEKIGNELDTPKAIVCMSAHWLKEGSFITSNLKPEIIYDFYGFPEALFLVKYPVKGDPKLASLVNKINRKIKPFDKWGMDHGAWSVLKRMFPDASIPVLQISIDYSVKPAVQFKLMETLKDLRNDNILFIGSGNIVHNLKLASENHKPYDWALEFEDKCKKLIEKGDVKSLIEYRKIGSLSELSVPTDDHYRPMLNTLALKYDEEMPSFFNQGIDLASISMLSFMYK